MWNCHSRMLAELQALLCNIVSVGRWMAAIYSNLLKCMTLLLCKKVNCFKEHLELFLYILNKSYTNLLLKLLKECSQLSNTDHWLIEITRGVMENFLMHFQDGNWKVSTTHRLSVWIMTKSSLIRQSIHYFTIRCIAMFKLG